MMLNSVHVHLMYQQQIGKGNRELIMATEKVFLDGSETFIRLDADDNHVFGSNKASEHIIGKAGDDQIIGGKGEDILEGNRGDDTLKGGDDSDLLFGGVGNDRLIGGEGSDTFAMRITHGGENTITDFKVGTDNLQFILNRKHFISENELTRNEKHESRVDEKLSTKVEKLDNKFFGEDLTFNEDATGLEKADVFVDKAIAEKLSISVENSNLVLTFFEDVGKGNKGTTITLNGLAEDPYIARILDDAEDPVDAQTTENIVGILTGEIPVFEGSVLDYHYQNRLTVTDTVDDRDGIVQLDKTVEKASFADGTYTLVTGHNAYDNLKAEDGVDSLLIGTHGHDDLTGGTGNDVLIGDNGVGFTYNGGNDNLNGGAGDDILHGGAGNDRLDGGEGVDKAIFSGSVLDYNYLHQSGGNTEVRDLVGGRDGNDFVKNTETFAFADGEFAFLRGHNAGDNLTAGNVDTLLVGFTGDDTLNGGGGDDVLLGDNGVGFTYQGGNDVLNGGEGDDLLHGGAGNDSLNGGTGVDTAVFSGSYKEYHFQNRLTVTDTVAGRDGKDQLQDVEKVTFTEGTYTLVTGHNAYDNLKGEDDVDSMLIGTHGHDDLTGGSGNDVLFGDNGVGFTYQGGDDTLDGGAGSDYIHAGSGDDTIYADKKAPAHLAVNAEDDVIIGADGIDTLIYNETYKNADSIRVDVSGDEDIFNVDTMLSGNVTSTDIVSGIEVLHATRGDDVIDLSGYVTGTGVGVTIHAGKGDDTVTGTKANDEIYTSQGNDTIYASLGNDIIKDSNNNNSGNDHDVIIYEGFEIVDVAVQNVAYQTWNVLFQDIEGNVFTDVISHIEEIKDVNGSRYLEDGFDLLA